MPSTSVIAALIGISGILPHRRILLGRETGPPRSRDRALHVGELRRSTPEARRTDREIWSSVPPRRSARRPLAASAPAADVQQHLGVGVAALHPIGARGAGWAKPRAPRPARRDRRAGRVAPTGGTGKPRYAANVEGTLLWERWSDVDRARASAQLETPGMGNALGALVARFTPTFSWRRGCFADANKAPPPGFLPMTPGSGHRCRNRETSRRPRARILMAHYCVLPHEPPAAMRIGSGVMPAPDVVLFAPWPRVREPTT